MSAAPAVPAQVAAAFRAATGHDPGRTWWAPGRVNLIGEHTDYNSGLALPVAIDRGTVVAAGPRHDGVVRCVSLDRPGEPAEVAVGAIGPAPAPGWAAYVLGVVRELVRAGVAISGLDLVVGSELPLGSGLASSAALEVATATAVLDLAGAVMTPGQMARACQVAEHELAGAPTGVMDQLAVLEGRRDHAVLIDCRSLLTTPVALGCDRWGAELLVMDTRVHHRNSAPGYAARRRECAEAARALGVDSLREADLAGVENHLTGVLRRRARHVVTENARVLAAVEALADARGAHELGGLLRAGHASLRDDFEVSCAELDVAVDSASAAGAYGARMTGGGFGGCAVAIAPLEARAAVRDAVTAAFAAHGFRSPDVFPVRASDGPRSLG